MEVALIKQKFTSVENFKEALTNFFKINDPDAVQVLFWKLFQCWVTKDCNIKADLSDKEVALFFDQLMDLVAAAYILHEANRVSEKPQEGKQHE